MMKSVALLSLLLVAPAWAHDDGKPNWITEGGYTSPSGVHCCGPNDCEKLDPKQIQETPRGLILHAYHDELVPYSEATPSEDGHYWRCHTAILRSLDGMVSGGDRRCFFAPVGTE